MPTQGQPQRQHQGPKHRVGEPLIGPHGRAATPPRPHQHRRHRRHGHIHRQPGDELRWVIDIAIGGGTALATGTFPEKPEAGEVKRAHQPQDGQILGDVLKIQWPWVDRPAGHEPMVQSPGQRQPQPPTLHGRPKSIAISPTQSEGQRQRQHTGNPRVHQAPPKVGLQGSQREQPSQAKQKARSRHMGQGQKSQGTHQGHMLRQRSLPTGFRLPPVIETRPVAHDRQNQRQQPQRHQPQPDRHGQHTAAPNEVEAR